jgi:hypothetical protein
MTTYRLAVFALLASTLLTSTAHAVPLNPPRAGQVGIGFQFAYGQLLQTGDFGNEFGGGASYDIRMRYRMRYDRAIGLSFESHRYDVNTVTPLDPNDQSTIAPERLNSSLAGFDLYQMFGTRTANVKMISISAGIAQERVKLNDGETEVSGHYSGDGIFLGAGLGLERYVYRSIALDLSGRYHAIFRDGKPHHDVQAAIGFIFYAGY